MNNAAQYRLWISDHRRKDVTANADPAGHLARILPDPDERGLFSRGASRCVLPYLRVYWKAPRGEGQTRHAPWEPESWQPFGMQEEGQEASSAGFVRFLRADQLLDCILGLADSAEDSSLLSAAARDALRNLLVPVDEDLREHTALLDRRVETVRLLQRGDRWHWSRKARFFPDELRVSVPAGIDPVHTPESERAGLTRYLCEGWHIDDGGQLADGGSGHGWGASTGSIPHRLHDGPRRLMLGASLQSRGVPLIDLDPPREAEQTDWSPHGRELRASFTMVGGWTHEDAIVLSKSAAEKLRRRLTKTVRIHVPATATRVELPDTENGPVPVQDGQVLARAFVDTFALGLRHHEAEQSGAERGWLEVALPGAYAPIDGQLSRIVRKPLRTPHCREEITFEVERLAPVRIGDKLATRHGIKGVVSLILPDADMPETSDGPAEIALSPLGIIRRGAMGQLREAAPPHESDLPRSGVIAVSRQPQDADVPERCRVRGPETRDLARHRGQRYGEMEFWALMAHDAPAIAKELLSVHRSTAPWMDWEGRIESGDHRTLSTRAMNRYFASAGVQIEKGRLVTDRDPPGFFEIEPKWTGSGDARDRLDDPVYFSERGGLGRLKLDRTLCVFLGREDDSPKIELDALPVVPPWLRPSSARRRHPLTQAYWRVMTRLSASGWKVQWTGRMAAPLDALVGDCVRLALSERLGAGGFLRREVLGRRLTRTARAVIVPRPDLRIDQIAIPEWMAARLFDGLPEDSRRLVLVNRNPTLHRRGLLALRPVIDGSNASHVFGFPLGILQAMGADFDGDQATVVALETNAALVEAERLLPGAPELRCDPFRGSSPAFPLVAELSNSAAEQELATKTGPTQEDWCQLHATLQQEQIDRLGNGWSHPLVTQAVDKSRDLWAGLDDTTWRALATTELDKILRGVRRKGRFGGVLRRQLYRLPFVDEAFFSRALQATQTITERMTQTALSVKSGEGAIPFQSKKYFADPRAGARFLSVLDDSGNSANPPLDAGALAEALDLPAGKRCSLLEWLARPESIPQADDDVTPHTDIRLDWFLA